MRPTVKKLTGLLAILFLLLACQFSGTATPALVNGSTAVPNGGNDAGGATATAPFTYVNQENGVNVHYPNGWTTQSCSFFRSNRGIRPNR
jgi:uncharacterized protein YfaP (DUF2135 family)